MPIEAKDFLSVAELVLENSNDEIYIRTAISRCYYSMYHKALSILENEPIRYPRKGCHAGLIEYLLKDAARYENHDRMKLKRMSFMLQQEKDKRVDADYELSQSMTIDQLNESFKTAKRFYDLCDQPPHTEKLAS